MLLVVWLATTLAFFGLRMLPGDAIEAQLARNGAGEVFIEQRRAELGLTDSLSVQYIRFMSGMLQGDLGQSLGSGQPVTRMILQQLQPTASLAFGALIVAVALGLTLGIGGALSLPYGIPFIARSIVNMAFSIPIYWTGTIVVFVFAVQLGSGNNDLSRLIAPIAVLGFHTSGSIARIVQANIRDTLDAEFIWTARAKGLRERHVVWRHILRVGLLPVITVIALQAGFLLSGTVITESLFVRPGIGKLLLDSTLRQDYPVVQGIVVIAAIIYTLVNTIADLTYSMLDPRVSI